MKKTLLLLVPLLAACAPTVTQPVLVDHVAMFHVGQVMKVAATASPTGPSPPVAVSASPQLR